MTDEIELAEEAASVTMTGGLSMATEPAESSDAETGSRSIQHVAANGFVNQIPDVTLRMPPQAAHSSFPSGSLMQIPIAVKVILGSAKMTLGKMASLGPGSILTLDQKLSEPVILMANGNQIAKGLLVVLNEESGEIGISLTEIIAELADEKLSA